MAAQNIRKITQSDLQNGTEEEKPARNLSWKKKTAWRMIPFREQIRADFLLNELYSISVGGAIDK